MDSAPPQPVGSVYGPEALLPHILVLLHLPAFGSAAMGQCVRVDRSRDERTLDVTRKKPVSR